MRIQERDVRIVDAVQRHYVLSSSQIAALFFPSVSGEVSSACRTRLRLLTQAGYLQRREQLTTPSEGRRPYLYFLTRGGADLLVAELGLHPDDLAFQPRPNVKWPFLRHQLDINNVYVALKLAAPGAGWRIQTWVDDRILRKDHTDYVRLPSAGRRVAVVPDAFFILKNTAAELRFFLEVDRSTMSVAATSDRTKSWRTRIEAYQAYYTSGAVQKRYGTDKIRVLTVTTGGQRRMKNLKAATEEGGGRFRYWFTAMEQLAPETVLSEPIWQVASSEVSHALIRGDD